MTEFSYKTRLPNALFLPLRPLAPPSTSVHLLHNQLIASRCLSRGDKRGSDESANRFSQCKLHGGVGRGYYLQHNAETYATFDVKQDDTAHQTSLLNVLLQN